MIVENALRFAEVGIPVFPLLGDSKYPVVDEFPEVASTDPEKIRRFFTDPVMGWVQPYNIGLLMRHHVALDIDNKDGKNGSVSLEFLRDVCGCAIPPTLTQYTPTGGIHLVYSIPKDVTVRNSAGELAAGIDVRGWGGYLVGGGSTVPKGSYRTLWAPIVPAPRWLLDRLSRASARTGQAAPRSNWPEINTDMAIASGKELVCARPGATQGSRDSTAYSLACKLSNLGVPEFDAYELLNEHWAPRCDPPFPADELVIPVENGYRYVRDKGPIDAPEVMFDGLSTEEPVAKTEEAAKPAKVDPIVELNERYAFVISGSSHHILFETTAADGSPKVVHLSEDSFHAKLGAQTKMVKGKPVAISRLWMKSAARRSYDGFCFAPGQEHDARYYNVWKGFAYEPADLTQTPTDAAREGLELFLEHSLKNICAGDQALHEWLIGYFAHIFQKPSEKPGVAIVFRGKKGVGKNALLNHIGALLGTPHFRVTSNKRFLVGNFNSHLEGLIGIVLDEAFWSGAKDVEGILKDLITGDTHIIERKGKEPYVVDSCLRTFILGNERWLIPATEDERRFAVFEVGEGRRLDEEFFERMKLGLQAGGYSLLLRYFLDYDLSKVRVRRAPDTIGLYNQKTMTLNPFERWWYDSLHDGVIKGSTFIDGWPTTIDRNELRESYWNYKEKRRIKGWGETSEEFGSLWSDMVPSLKVKRHRVDGKVARSYAMPTLDECRKLFEQRMKHQINWEDEE